MSKRPHVVLTEDQKEIIMRVDDFCRKEKEHVLEVIKNHPFYKDVVLLGWYIPFYKDVVLLGWYIPFYKDVVLLGWYIPFYKDVVLLGWYIPIRLCSTSFR